MALLANGERQLIVRNDDFHALRILVHDDLRDLGGSERSAYELGGIGRPIHDVDLLAAKLLHDRLHPRSFHSHAGAHRIDVGVIRGDGDLRPASRLASHGLDLDDALVNLGNLLLEGLLEKARMRAGQDDLRSLARHVHVEHVSANAVLRAVALARNLLFFGENCVNVGPELNDQVLALEAGDDPGDDFFLAVLELVEDDLALRIAELLHEVLLGGLRGDTPVAGIDFLEEIVADFCLGIETLTRFLD